MASIIMMTCNRRHKRFVCLIEHMKTLFQRLAVIVVSVCATLNVSAAPAGELLRHAYATLERADHDYKGHRHDAMKQIEAAAKLLGINVRGDGKGHEHQGVSDAQLHEAMGMLEQARGELKGKPLHHVNSAIKQLNIALSIK